MPKFEWKDKHPKRSFEQGAGVLLRLGEVTGGDLK